jgi:hypothetical protein
MQQAEVKHENVWFAKSGCLLFVSAIRSPYGVLHIAMFYVHIRVA